MEETKTLESGNLVSDQPAAKRQRSLSEGNDDSNLDVIIIFDSVKGTVDPEILEAKELVQVAVTII
jgi:hypothetical protein